MSFLAEAHAVLRRAMETWLELRAWRSAVRDAHSLVDQSRPLRSQPTYIDTWEGLTSDGHTVSNLSSP